MNKRLKKSLGAGLAALAVVVAGGGYYYFHVHTDTPAHAIEAVGESIAHHDLKEFHRAVNVDSVLDSGYEGFADGLAAIDSTATPETQEALRNVTRMLREPMMLSLKAALESYVATGKLNPEQNVGVLELLERTGLNGAEIRDVKNVELNDADKNQAFADVMVYQPELGRDFPIEIVLARGKDDRWQITRVKNFQEYVAQITQARREQLNQYLAQAAEINARHDVTVRAAEEKYGLILSAGSLAQDKTRAELKTLIDDTFKRDWELRKQELFGLHVPKDAEPLHNLYLRICDVWLDAAHDYGRWLDDNNALTIRAAEDKIHQAQELTSDAGALAKRMTS